MEVAPLIQIILKLFSASMDNLISLKQNVVDQQFVARTVSELTVMPLVKKFDFQFQIL